MVQSYEDYLPTTTTRDGPDGKTVVRQLYIWADTEAELFANIDYPVRGTTIDIVAGSGQGYLYCRDIGSKTLKNVAPIEAGVKFLWEVTATFVPLSGPKGNPVVNKAKMRVDFRESNIHINHVESDSDQTHIGATGSDIEVFPAVTTGINVTDEGPQGVDIPEMEEILIIDFWKTPAAVPAFLDAARLLGGHTNLEALEGPWGSYAAGEARISGIGLTQLSGELAQVSVEFSIGENRTGLGSGGNALNIYLDTEGGTVQVEKEGWQYVWVRSLKSVSKTDETEVKPRSIDVHVATMPGMDKISFDPLGISDGIFV